jgi:hypothetical protein
LEQAYMNSKNLPELKEGAQRAGQGSLIHPPVFRRSAVRLGASWYAFVRLCAPSWFKFLFPVIALILNFSVNKELFRSCPFAVNAKPLPAFIPIRHPNLYKVHRFS